jgi:hypothetical protein
MEDFLKFLRMKGQKKLFKLPLNSWVTSESHKVSCILAELAAFYNHSNTGAKFQLS